MGEGIDWRHRGEYISKHGLTPDVADEAFADPNRLAIDPDPSSDSGRTIRVIGWSSTTSMLITVIVLPDEGITWGVNAWPSNSTDQRRYREEQLDVDQ
ncbi:BrnT family toxin [Tessaracoccus sp. Y36]|uniref:BrnT family toxin n=1 Tax=unclassified Tessaracoccus TaxID=2635419 RepID=UPI00117C64C7|nr:MULTISPECIES: BrnT family toxin [unclassified Tessaracoccus]MBO1031314.1 transposase [Tessaracoccus sp. SD287]MCG6568449.1 transposase [Tessaracoccus sp. ZS01]